MVHSCWNQSAKDFNDFDSMRLHKNLFLFRFSCICFFVVLSLFKSYKFHHAVSKKHDCTYMFSLNSLLVLMILRLGSWKISVNFRVLSKFFVLFLSWWLTLNKTEWITLKRPAGLVSSQLRFSEASFSFIEGAWVRWAHRAQQWKGVGCCVGGGGGVGLIVVVGGWGSTSEKRPSHHKC